MPCTAAVCCRGANSEYLLPKAPNTGTLGPDVQLVLEASAAVQRAVDLPRVLDPMLRGVLQPRHSQAVGELFPCLSGNA